MSTDNSQAPRHHHKILKSSGIVASGVLASRCLGFLRDMVLARFLGTGFIAEAFFVAQRIPNLFRDLVGEGAANAAIIPVLAEYSQQKSREDWQECINVIMTWGVIILGGITVLGIFLAPWIIRIMAPGFIGHAGQLDLSVNLTRIMFPYLILIALTAFQTGILYSLNVFFVPAFGPCLLNAAMIVSAWIAVFFSWPLAYALAVGVLIGGVWQFLFQWSALRRHTVFWRWPKTLIHPGIGKIARLLLPRLWGTAIYQVNITVDTICASWAMIVGDGGIAAIYYANRIIQLPLAVFGYALSSVALPSLSKLAQQSNMILFRSTLYFSVRNLMLILIPIAGCLVFYSKHIIQIVFERGAFDAYSTSVTASVLMYTAIGLPFFGASRIFVSAYYALQDTKTPVKAATAALIVNIVLNIVLMFPMKIAGIALASSVAGAVNCYILWQGLRHKVIWRWLSPKG